MVEAVIGTVILILISLGIFVCFAVLLVHVIMKGFVCYMNWRPPRGW